MGRHPQSGLRLSDAVIRNAFAGDWAAEYPPILSVGQAAKLAGVSMKTIYDWSSRRLLQSCAHKKGKHLRIFRDLFVRFLFTSKE